MKTSVVITNYLFDAPFLMDCWCSLRGKSDEVLIISSKQSSLSEKVNAGIKATRGEYIIFTNDDAYLYSGSLEDLCVPNTVTTPTFNHGDRAIKFHVFCVPRAVFEKIGGYDERFAHAYYDDTDFARRCADAGIPIINVDTVDFMHENPASTLSKIDGQFRGENAAKFNAKWNE